MSSLSEALFNIKNNFLSIDKLLFFPLIIFVTIFILLAFFHNEVNHVLRFERVLIYEGQWWRLLTAHIVHLNINHMLMNTIGFVLGTLILSSAVKVWQWYGALVICALSVSFGLLLFDQNLQDYVGLSGALYGLLAFGLLLNIKTNTWPSLLLYVYIHYKAVDQVLPGFDENYLYDVIGGYVVATAHIYGLITGNLLGFLLLIYKFGTKRLSD